MTICDSVQITYKGDGYNRIYTFPFTYLSQEDVDVLLWDEVKKEYQLVDRTDWSFVNATTIQFNNPPPPPTVSTDPADPVVYNVKISRSTDLSEMVATFYPGSAIRAEDLNDDFDQLRLAIQEGLCEVKGNFRDWVKTHYWAKLTDTITREDQKKGKWTGDLKDKYLATADAISQRLDPYVTDTTPATMLLPYSEQDGKQWFDNEDIVGRYWDADADAWITLANTGPIGPKGDPGPPGLDVHIGNTPPTDIRRAWYHTGRGRLLIWYDDGDSRQWVDASPSIAGTPGGTGVAGPVGAVGPQGPIGLTGPQGPQGIQGVKGDKGDVGPQGPQGLNGVAGPAGPKGQTGTGIIIKGSIANAAALPTTGNTTGDMWIATDTGNGHVWEGTKFHDVGKIQGPKGDIGDSAKVWFGDSFPTDTKVYPLWFHTTQAMLFVYYTDADSSQWVSISKDGAEGPQGLTGPQGPQGIQGIQGIQGNTGPQGADGDSAGFGNATAVALAAGTAPTVTLSGPDTAIEFEFGIPAGPKGAKGDPAIAATPVEIKAGTDSTKFVSASGLAGADLYLKNNESDSTTGRLTFNASTGNSWETAPTRGTVGQVLTSDGTGKTNWKSTITAAVVSDTPPATPTEGLLWYNGAKGILYTFMAPTWVST